MRSLPLARTFVVGLVLGLAACSRPSAELTRAVRDYDDALVRAYSASDASGMVAVAAPKEAQRVQVLVDLKSGAKLALESRLESFEVTRAEEKGDAATVETRERWRYHDRRLQPGAPPGPELVSQMTMRYALVRDGGRWKVESVSTLSNDYQGAQPKP